MTDPTYSEKDIRVLEGLEAVRKRPGMYIGSTGPRGLHHLIDEIVDNAIDEALAGVCTRIDVCLEADNVVTVRDDGRGIPIGRHDTGIPVPELVFTRLHAGAKFGSESYKVSGGLHGVGAAVVNALSEWLELLVERGGERYTQRFARGIPEGPPTRAAGSRRRGTTVRFRPDPVVFGELQIETRNVVERLRELAFLNAGLALHLIETRGEERRDETFQYSGGIRDFVTYLNEGKKALHDPVSFIGTADGIEVEVAFQYNDGYAECVNSFVNCICTVEGGYHETGFKAAHTRVMNDVARALGLWKKKSSLSGEDLREGLMAVLSLRMCETEFEGQTKTKLGNTEARAAVERVAAEHLAAFFEQNPDVTRLLVAKATQAEEARLAARQVREGTRTATAKLARSSLEGKLTRCALRDPEQIELFIVEGDSAGGNAKQGRDRAFQAILPMRGKVLNTERAAMEKILKNKEILSIIQTLGAGVGSELDASRCRYGRIIILADADEDGAHIRCLLITFFYRYMRPLITGGHLYLARPPLFKVEKKRSRGAPVVEYAWTPAEMSRIKQRLDPGATVQRYKGLGEMSAVQLWETTMNPKTRTLMQVTIEDAAGAERHVSVLMGSSAPSRRDWITENVRFRAEAN
ncbi:MAG: DNA gyrase subunit B [Candidatus Schekmanbacteria bacterium]|nr:DNA gyrase subunit B [Candidatus Schekmanbacteria bacterium]